MKSKIRLLSVHVNEDMTQNQTMEIQVENIGKYLHNIGVRKYLCGRIPNRRLLCM